MGIIFAARSGTDWNIDSAYHNWLCFNRSQVTNGTVLSKLVQLK